MPQKYTYQRRELNLYLSRIEALNAVIQKHYPDCLPSHDPRENATAIVCLDMIRNRFYTHVCDFRECIGHIKHPLHMLRILKALNRQSNNKRLLKDLRRAIDTKLVDLSTNIEATNKYIKEQYNEYDLDINSDMAHAEWLRKAYKLDDLESI